MEKKIVLMMICIGLMLPFISSFVQLIDPTTEVEVETWINNSNFGWGDYNITANYGFFDYLGSFLSPIIQGYFTQIDIGTIWDSMGDLAIDLDMRRLYDLYGDIAIDWGVVSGAVEIATNLSVWGNLDVDGNVTAENVFLHAHIFTHTNVSLTVVGIGIWTNITFDVHEPPIQHRITHNWTDATNDTFTIQDTGEYLLEANLILIDSAALPDSNVEYRFIRNNVEIDGSGRPIDIDRQDHDRVSDTFVSVGLTAGDEIKLQFTSDSATAGLSQDCLYLDHCTSAVINIERVG